MDQLGDWDDIVPCSAVDGTQVDTVAEVLTSHLPRSPQLYPDGVTTDESETVMIAELVREGDTRWIHRPAYDLLDVAPQASASASGMPRARTLHGPIDAQLQDPRSFVRRLKDLLHLRGYFAIATTRQVDVPDVAHPAMLVMVHAYEQVPGQLQVTVLNFGEEPISGTVISEHLEPGSRLMDMGDGSAFGEVDQLHGFHVELEGFAGLALLVTAPRSELA